MTTQDHATTKVHIIECVKPTPNGNFNGKVPHRVPNLNAMIYVFYVYVYQIRTLAHPCIKLSAVRCVHIYIYVYEYMH